MPYVGTTLGRLIDPLSDDLTKSDRDTLFKECAAAISKKNRYNGHTCEPYTVGQHTLILLTIVNHFSKDYGDAIHNLRMTVLLHDMHEAFTGDMPRPLKRVLPEFTAFEEKIAEKVQKCLWGSLGSPLPNSVKLLNMIDTDICAAWEMPTFKVGFYHSQEVNQVTLRTGMQLMLRSLSYRDLIPPEIMELKGSDQAVNGLLEKFEVIRLLSWQQVQESLQNHYEVIADDLIG